MHRLGLVALCAIAALTSPLNAQEVGPHAGTWGAEASLDDRVSILRFRNATSAWLLSFSSTLIHRRDDNDSEETISNTSVLLGIRGYRRPDTRVRPFSGIAAIVGYESNPFEGGGMFFGGTAEAGAAYFFSSHVSLGTALDLSATYSKTSGTDVITGASVDVTNIFARASIRFLGAVYF